MRTQTNVLVKGMHKQEVLRLARRASSDEALYSDLLAAIRSGEMTPAMKASWIIATSASMDPGTASGYTGELLELLSNATIGGVQRELLKAIFHLSLDPAQEGRFLDIAFRLLSDHSSDVGVKHYCMKIIEKKIKIYPELSGEFVAVLQSQFNSLTPPAQKYAMRIIQQLM